MIGGNNAGQTEAYNLYRGFLWSFAIYNSVQDVNVIRDNYVEASDILNCTNGCEKCPPTKCVSNCFYNYYIDDDNECR